MKTEFNDTAGFHPGLIQELLIRSYAKIAGTTQQDRANFEKFDRDVTDHPQWLGRCVFITTVDGTPVGFASFDPRKKPLAQIGHNCVVPEHRGVGLGKEQIRFVLTQIQQQGFEKVAVSTCEHADFIPAQKMYRACGFRETRRFVQEGHGEEYTRMIQYELSL